MQSMHSGSRDLLMLRIIFISLLIHLLFLYQIQAYILNFFKIAQPQTIRMHFATVLSDKTPGYTSEHFSSKTENLNQPIKRPQHYQFYMLQLHRLCKLHCCFGLYYHQLNAQHKHYAQHVLVKKITYRYSLHVLRIGMLTFYSSKSKLNLSQTSFTVNNTVVHYGDEMQHLEYAYIYVQYIYSKKCIFTINVFF